LKAFRNADQVPPLSQGLNIEKSFCQAEKSSGECVLVESARTGEHVMVRLTLTLPQDTYYLAVEDYIPAGSEILDRSLETSQQGEDFEPEAIILFDPRQPYAEGWGWWLFNPQQIYDDHITWTANFLPAGTYQLSYMLTTLQAGEYKVLPARAWQLYFPEVQGHSAGNLFMIKPE
jgi:alpha-2-macroglobulin